MNENIRGPHLTNTYVQTYAYTYNPPTPLAVGVLEQTNCIKDWLLPLDPLSLVHVLSFCLFLCSPFRRHLFTFSPFFLFLCQRSRVKTSV